MENRKNGMPRPPIRMIDEESERIAELALGAETRLPDVAALLLDEIDRARLMPAAEIPPDVVTMGSQVEFTDARSGERRTVRLVWPAHADIDAGRVSILTPVGAGLIGLSPGQSIAWPDRDGRVRTLDVLRVAPPAG